MRILVIEDQKKIASFIKSGLKQQGFAVDLCHTGEDGLFNATNESYAAIVLDVMLPGRDGLSILRMLREKGVATPVILLTARGELSERVEGLNAGADDYLTKPFYVEELTARIHALIRRTMGAPANVLKAGRLTLDVLKREVRNGDERIELSAREFALLEYFMRSPDRVLTRSQIGQHVWNLHFDPGTNLVEVAIGRLRKKIASSGGHEFILTVRGFGYKLPSK